MTRVDTPGFVRPEEQMALFSDDARRGFGPVASAECALEQAKAREWTVISVKGDWAPVVQGNLLDHEYEITRSGQLPVATISLRWFSLRGTYGVEVAPGQDDALILAVTVYVAAMVQDD